MTLHIFPEVEQRSDEWFEQRRGIVTASVVGQLITTKTLKPADNDNSRGLTAALVAERITNYTEPTWVSADMERGIFDEPLARDLYSETWEPVTECGFMVREEADWKLGYSPDGLVGDDGLIEVKSRRQKKQLLTVLADEIPAENMAQIQAGLLVSGRDWCDYLSWCGGMKLWRKRITPDPRWFDAIEAACIKFEQTAAEWVNRYEQATEGLPDTERPNYDLELVI